MSAPRLLLAGLLSATTLAASAMLGSGHAQAQVFFNTWNERFTIPLYEPAPRYRMERDRRLHPSIIVDELEDRGFRDLVVVARRADVYVIEGVSPRTGVVRLVVDAYDGEILQRDAIRRSDARIVGEDRNSGLSSGSVAALPTPPLRRMPIPNAEVSAPKPVPPKVAGPMPEPTVTPTRPALPAPAPALPATRPPSADWNPINSVPVAPLL
ncbi:MAG: hypothetical protein MUF11_09390 [Beijerinckiaceae bacterium]|jgi:hypothetical protein|nr:hypothetical protein [Beijerinckiaceae bacterium]